MTTKKFRILILTIVIRETIDVVAITIYVDRLQILHYATLAKSSL